MTLLMNNVYTAGGAMLRLIILAIITMIVDSLHFMAMVLFKSYWLKGDAGLYVYIAAPFVIVIGVAFYYYLLMRRRAKSAIVVLLASPIIAAVALGVSFVLMYLIVAESV